jgi:hypothetical protein
MNDVEGCGDDVDVLARSSSFRSHAWGFLGSADGGGEAMGVEVSANPATKATMSVGNPSSEIGNPSGGMLDCGERC